MLEDAIKGEFFLVLLLRLFIEENIQYCDCILGVVLFLERYHYSKLKPEQ